MGYSDGVVRSKEATWFIEICGSAIASPFGNCRSNAFATAVVLAIVMTMSGLGLTGSSLMVLAGCFAST
jgi:hypothetical protein